MELVYKVHDFLFKHWLYLPNKFECKPIWARILLPPQFHTVILTSSSKKGANEQIILFNIQLLFHQIADREEPFLRACKVLFEEFEYFFFHSIHIVNPSIPND